jgi:DNA invertase Pin-like site-specific DNA recombinase
MTQSETMRAVMPTADLPAAGYFRVSVAREDMRAPEIYTEEIERYCRYRCLVLAEVFSDIDYSAYRGSKPRPALEELKTRRFEFSSVVIPKLARFGRSVKDLVYLFDLFDRDGIALVFLDMNIDTSTSQGRLLRHIMAAFAEYESDVKADYTRANHRRARAEGRAWGTTPFGYRRGDGPGTWVIDEASASTIRLIFERYADGASANAVARELNAAGISTARGTRWEGKKVGKLLDNPAYAALSIMDDGFVTAQWPAIIERAVWDRARTRRAADPHRRSNLGKRRPVMPYLLSGLMWCGQCGRKMSHTTTSRDHAALYVCSGEDWGTWTGCRNARLYGSLVEAEVTERFLERCAFTIVTESGTRAGSPRILWAEASLPERKRLLSLVIDRIVAIPRETHIPRSQWRTRLRHDLRIEWKTDVAERDDIVLVADAPGTAEERVVSNGRHEMLRAKEVESIASESKERSARTKAYYEEWRRFRQTPVPSEVSQHLS